MIKAFLKPALLLPCSQKSACLCTVFQRYNSKQAGNITVAPLDHRLILKVSGRDSVDFLQGLLTNDVTQLKDKRCMFSMMLNTKGRVEHDFLLYSVVDETDNSGSILLECEHNSADRVISTFKKYKLRKKVMIDDNTGFKVWQAMNNDETPKDISELVMNTFGDKLCFADPRTTDMGLRIVAKSLTVPEAWIGSNDYYHTFRYKHGVPEGEEDLPPGKCLPLESNVDIMNGISFDKGCYLGQELTARTHHTGVVRKRLTPVSFYSNHEIKAGDQLISGRGEIAAKLRSVKGTQGLALLKLKHLRHVLFHMSSDQVRVKPREPVWWPQDI